MQNSSGLGEIALSLMLLCLAGAIVLLWRRLKSSQSECYHLQNRLADAIEQTQVLLHTIRDGVITTNAHGQVELLNPVAEYLTQWQTREAQGRSLSEILPLRDCTTGEPLLEFTPNHTLERHTLNSAARAALLQTKDQTEKQVDSTQIEIYAPTGQITSRVIVLREAATLLAAGRVATWQDRYDALTGLVNRQEFEHCLQQTIALMPPDSQEHSLCLLDLDRFREINQICGYGAGNDLLRQVSRLLQGKVRRADTIARLGGDEFAILLYQCPTEQAMYVAQSLCEAIENLWFEWQGQQFSVGVSIGLVGLTADADPVTALKAADKACTIAKRHNQGGVHLYQMESPSAASASRLGSAEILQALESNRLRLYRQKILPLHGEETSHAVLLRMVDSSGNLVAPAEFTTAAASHQFIDLLDRWVITTLLASQTRSAAVRSRYSISLSEGSLTDPQFAEFLQEQFQTCEVAPHRICFNLSESAIRNRLETAVPFIQRLKQMGCQVAIADFDGNLTTLTDLAELPIDYLKIRAALIQSLLTDPATFAIVEGIHHTAHRLGMKTIAGAVSTLEIQRKLAAIGIDYLQGDAVAEPQELSAQTLKTVLETQSDSPSLTGK
ncbi:EAL domain-containing protein [Leptolyngbya ohadii]|uniref:EAL domain-containing protein n=1 Tax=Leptolyngbya ohadii TaxID=1962290 RepID=UPI0015C68ED8|nr:EAL domain-containing protein [Leptolyngbya ohadii]